jgi:hypothetical protein
MKQRITQCLVILFPILLIGCTYTSTSVITVDNNYKEVNQATRRVTSELNMEEMKTEDSLDAYVRRNGSVSVYAIRPVIKTQTDSSTQVTLFTVTQAQEISDNLGKTFSSFYRQSLDSSLVDKNPEKFFRLEPKSSSEMYRKNWISPALGIHYVGKNNPFVEKADYTVGVVGMAFFDGLCLFAAFGGPFIGKTSKDKIGISITGILGLVGWRLLAPSMQGSRDLEEYNNIVNTKYSLPVEIKRE